MQINYPVPSINNFIGDNKSVNNYYHEATQTTTTIAKITTTLQQKPPSNSKTLGAAQQRQQLRCSNNNYIKAQIDFFTTLIQELRIYRCLWYSFCRTYRELIYFL